MCVCHWSSLLSNHAAVTAFCRSIETELILHTHSQVHFVLQITLGLRWTCRNAEDPASRHRQNGELFSVLSPERQQLHTICSRNSHALRQLSFACSSVSCCGTRRGSFDVAEVRERIEPQLLRFRSTCLVVINTQLLIKALILDSVACLLRQMYLSSFTYQ